MTRTWTKEQVITVIRAEYRDGESLRYATQEERVLYRQAKRCFGNWNRAMATAGLTAVRHPWSKQRVLDEISAGYAHRLWKRGFWSERPKLREAATRLFGSTHAALVAAGFQVAKPKPMQRWTKRTILAAIRARHQQGLAMCGTWREDGALYATARRLYGTWYKALAAGGVSPEHRRWTKQAVLAAICSRHRRGLPLEKTWKEDAALHGAGKLHFGSWRAAIRASGVAVPMRRQWTDDEVLDAVRTSLAQGCTVTQLWRENKRLYYAAVRRWGTWYAVMVAAGLDAKPRTLWSQDRVILELQAWYRTSRGNVHLGNPALAGAAWRLFGGLRKALEAASIEPVRRTWSRQRVIEAIQDQCVAGLPMDKPRDMSLCRAVKRYVGRWEEALVAAGIVRSKRIA